MRNDNSLATILLTSRLLDSAVKPFKAAEFWKLKKELDLLEQIEEPQFLLGKTADELIQMGVSQDSAMRIVELFDRATAMAFELKRLDGSGIRVLTPFDEDYPQIWLDRLSGRAPPVLYAAGAFELLNQTGVGVVGSRDVSSEGKEIAKEAAERIASRGMTLVSGGARGVDQRSMYAAFQAGGCVVGILADSLVRELKKSDVRQAIYEEQMVMCTPYNPDAPFSVGTAMGRNKLIYAMAELTLVVACEPDKGGTWGGAAEALKYDFGRVAVWRGTGQGTGNAQLEEKGAIPISSIDELESVILGHVDRYAEPADSDNEVLDNSDILEPVASDTPDALVGAAAAEEQLLPFESVV